MRAESLPQGLYSICGVSKEGKVTAIITHYSDNDDKENLQVELDFGKKAQFDIYLLDKDCDGKLVKTTDNLTFDMPVHSCVMVVEK